MATIDEVLSILLASKKILELPTASSIQSTDWLIFYNVNTAQAEKIQASQLTGAGFWLIIEGSLVIKDAGNTDITTLEINDEVYLKKITNETDPITLFGHTYIGGDKQLETSYQQNQAIVT